MLAPSISLCGVNGQAASPGANSTFYGSLGGSCAPTIGIGTEAQVQYALPIDGTLVNFLGSCSTNTRASSSTVVLVRKNGADTTLSVTFLASTTGVVQDTSHSVAVSKDDLISLKGSFGAGTGNFGASAAVQFNANSGEVSSLQNTAIAANLSFSTASSTNFVALVGDLVAASATEAPMQLMMQHACTANYFQAYVVGNNRTTTSTIKFRKNTADGAQNLSVVASATGLFKDTTNTDGIALNDKIDVSVTLGSGAGAITLGMVGAAFNSSILGQATGGGVLNTGVPLAAAATGYSVASGRISTFGSTESTRQFPPGSPVAVSRLSATVSTNASSASAALKLRKNSANGNSILTIGAGVTGDFQDTTNTDVFTSTDTMGLQGSGAVTGTVTFTAWSMLLITAVNYMIGYRPTIVVTNEMIDGVELFTPLIGDEIDAS